MSTVIDVTVHASIPPYFSQVVGSTLTRQAHIRSMMMMRVLRTSCRPILSHLLTCVVRLVLSLAVPVKPSNPFKHKLVAIFKLLKKMNALYVHGNVDGASLM